MAITTNDTARDLKSRVRTGSGVFFTAPKSFGLAYTDDGWRPEGNLTELDFNNMEITPIETATGNMSTIKNRNPGSATAQINWTTEDYDVIYGEELANKLELPVEVNYAAFTAVLIDSGSESLITFDNTANDIPDPTLYLNQLLAIPIGTADKLQTVSRYISNVNVVGSDIGFELEHSTCQTALPALSALVVSDWCQSVGGSKYQRKAGLQQTSFNDGGVCIMEIFDMQPTEGTLANNDPASANTSMSMTFAMNSVGFTVGSKTVPRFAKKYSFPGIC